MKAYLKIGEKYWLKTGQQESLILDEPHITNACDFNHFSNDNLVYIQCLLGGKPLGSVLGDYPRRAILESLHKKMVPQYKAINTIGISLDVAHKFVPKRLFEDFNAELLEALEYASEIVPMPADYRHLHYAWSVSEMIFQTPLKHDGVLKYIHYNAHPPKGYGRYGLHDGSFGILSCSREERNKIEPISDEYVVVEFDFNAFEIRTLLALCKIDQPPGDLYSILHTKQDHMTRAEFKQNLIASLYSNHPEKTPLDVIIRKRFLKERFPIKDGKITNIFGKTMESDPYHFFSRLLQSTAAYILFQQMFRLASYMNLFGHKSKIAFCIHDSVAMNVHKDELHHIETYEDILSDVSLPQLDYQQKFQMKTKQGKKYSELEIRNVVP